VYNNLYTDVRSTNVPGITKLIGIYDADGGIFGEIKYFYNKIFSNNHCSLCNITHGSSKNKKEWGECKKRLPIPIDFIHLNERNESIKKYTEDATPCIIGKTATGYITIIGKSDLESCKGNIVKFENILKEKLSNQ